MASVLAGAFGGLAAYTFDYGEGLSYFSTDPLACKNWSAAALTDLLDAFAAAKKAGATEPELTPVYAPQRKAQWRLDFVAAENSMGFHAPQETARVLAEAIDYARQGQLAARALSSRPVATHR